MKHYSRGELKPKVDEYMKQKREPVCYHIISADLDIPDANAYMALKRAEKQGVAVRCSMKGTCQWSKQAHTMFNYSGVVEREQKRSAEVGIALREEYEQKIKHLRNGHLVEVQSLLKRIDELGKAQSKKIVDDYFLQVCIDAMRCAVWALENHKKQLGL